MKYILTATKDVITGEYTPQMATYHNEAEAKRAWGNAIRALERSNPDQIPYEDFQVYQVAEFESMTGEITPNFKYLCRAQDFMTGGYSNARVQNNVDTKEQEEIPTES